MFPNPQVALPLPTHPNLEQYKKLAKDLVEACKSADPDAIGVWAAKWIDMLVRLAGLTVTPQLPVRIDNWIHQGEEFTPQKLLTSEGDEVGLADAQFVFSRSHGLRSLPK